MNLKHCLEVDLLLPYLLIHRIVLYSLGLINRPVFACQYQANLQVKAHLIIFPLKTAQKHPQKLFHILERPDPVMKRLYVLNRNIDRQKKNANIADIITQANRLQEQVIYQMTKVKE